MNISTINGKNHQLSQDSLYFFHPKFSYSKNVVTISISLL